MFHFNIFCDHFQPTTLEGDATHFMTTEEIQERFIEAGAKISKKN